MNDTRNEDKEKVEQAISSKFNQLNCWRQQIYQQPYKQIDYQRNNKDKKKKERYKNLSAQKSHKLFNIKNKHSEVPSSPVSNDLIHDAGFFSFKGERAGKPIIISGNLRFDEIKIKAAGCSLKQMPRKMAFMQQIVGQSGLRL